jgi:hypothetical protein
MNDLRCPPLRQWTILTLALLALAVTSGVGASGEAPRGAGESEKRPADGSTAPAPGPGSPRAAARAVLDPETGELTSRTVEIEWRQSSPRLREKLSRKSDDLHEEPLPGGGFMVDLRGRFHTLLVAKVEADGELRTRCVGLSAGQAEPATDSGGAPMASAAGAADSPELEAGADDNSGAKDG